MHVVDSNIPIHAVQPGHEFLEQWLKPHSAFLSAISIPEVLGFPGLNADDELIFERWFATLTVVDVSTLILRTAAGLRREIEDALRIEFNPAF